MEILRLIVIVGCVFGGFEIIVRGDSLSASARTDIYRAAWEKLSSNGVSGAVVDVGTDGTLFVQITDRSVSNLACIAGLPIRQLDLAETSVQDLAEVRDMPLESLSCNSTPISDLEPLRGMRLKELFIRNSMVSDIGPLMGMPLIALDISGTQVSNLTPLAGMPLRELYLREAPVQDLSPLSGAMLKRIGLQGTLINSLAGLGQSALEELDLSGCANLVDISYVQGMQIHRLALDETGVIDLEPLRGLQLERLSLVDTKIKDISPLKNMITLTHLDLTRTQVTNMAVLLELPLEELRGAGGQSGLLGQTEKIENSHSPGAEEQDQSR